MSKLDITLKEIEKKFGKGAVMKLGEQKAANNNALSSGSLLIDKILGGGAAEGRVVEIFGAESSGKSTLCLHFVAECQKRGGVVAYIDSEHAMDPEYARKLGVNIDELIFSQPGSGEEALEIADMIARSGDVALIVVDSVAALTPQAELDGEMSDQNIGLLARLMGKALRKLTGVCSENKCTCIFINQLRDKIATNPYAAMGDSSTTSGGRALKFFASQRIELKKTTSIKEGQDVIGYNVKIKTVKNKICPPMKTCEVPLIFGKGFSAEDEAIDLAVEYGIIQKAGAWFTTHDNQRFQGKVSVREYYSANKHLAEELRNLVKSRLSGIDIESQYEVNPETGEIIL